MRSIAIPEDLELKLGEEKKRFTFKKVITDVLDMSSVFGTRVAAKSAARIERLVEKAEDNGTACLEDADYELLKQALTSFSFNPAVARAMEKAGWFALVEEAKAL